jgi:peptide deformylase
MALLPILRYPDLRLKTVATPVTQFDDKLAKLVQDMAETMYDAPGVGLAATQVNVHKRVVVIDVSEEKNQLIVFVNPEVVLASSECKTYEEGCLSVPGIYDKVDRPSTVRVRAQNVKGEVFDLECDELLAVCIQHEIDHLNGKVFVEHLSQLKQIRIKNKLKKHDKAKA